MGKSRKLDDLRDVPRGRVNPKPVEVYPKQRRLPQPAGKIVLADSEKKDLLAIGWKEGDPVPTNMAELLAEAKQVREQIVQQGDEGFSDFNQQVKDVRPTQTKEVRLEDLPEELREEIMTSLKVAKLQDQAARRERDNLVPQAGPGINEAIQVAIREEPSMLRSDVIVENDLNAPAKTTTPTSPAAQPPPEEEGTQTGLDLTVKHCPRCDYDLYQKDDFVITESDRLTFIAAILGGQRFRKQIDLLGGKLSVIFRSLTVKEADMAFRQIVVDGHKNIEDKQIHPEGDYWRNLMAYRMIMSLESITTPENGTLEIEEIAKIRYELSDCPPPNTPLYIIYPRLIQQAVPNESLMHIIGSAYHEFQQLVERLEMKANDPNFWKTVEKPT